MTFDELKEEVFLLTNRRDRVAETESAIRAATIKAHKSDFYARDIFETGIQFPTSDYRQQLDYTQFISNFRAFKYFRRAEDAEDDSGPFFEIITPDAILDSYGINRTNIAYVAGRILEIRSDVEFQFGLLGVYVLPIVRTGAYSSWVAEQQPYVIIYESVRTLFKSFGQDEESATYTRLVAEEYNLLQASAISDVGY